jgi:flagellar assembly factor FliW
MSPANILVSTTGEDRVIETRFGQFAGCARDIVTFVEGLPGFEECRRFFLVSTPSIEPLTCLQGVDEPKPAFLAMDPRLIDSGYSCHVDDLQRQRLGATVTTPLLWLAIVCVGDAGESTVNLRAPLVVNPENMRGVQLLAGHDAYDTNHRLG